MNHKEQSSLFDDIKAMEATNKTTIAVATVTDSGAFVVSFNDTAYPIRQNQDGMYSLTDVYKAWKDSGGEGKRIDNWKDSDDFCLLSKLPDFQVVYLEGRNGGTWGNKFAVIEYAAHCSLAFRVAVNKAFQLLTEGKIHEAADIATKVAISPELIEQAEDYDQRLTDAIIKWTGDKDRSTKAKMFCIRQHIIQACVTGIYGRELKKSHNISSYRDYFIKENHVSGLTAYIACIQLVLPMLAKDMSYYDIKDILVTWRK